MKKFWDRVILVVLVLVVSLSFTACGGLGTVVVPAGYIQNAENANLKVMRCADYEELLYYTEDYFLEVPDGFLERFDESFFLNNSLLAVYVESNDNPADYSVYKVESAYGKITIYLNRDSSTESALDPSYWMVFVPLNDKFLNHIDQYEAIIRN